jgi:hypothetical protein
VVALVSSTIRLSLQPSPPSETSAFQQDPRLHQLLRRTLAFADHLVELLTFILAQSHHIPFYRYLSGRHDCPRRSFPRPSESPIPFKSLEAGHYATCQSDFAHAVEYRMRKIAYEAPLIWARHRGDSTRADPVAEVDRVRKVAPGRASFGNFPALRGIQPLARNTLVNTPTACGRVSHK